MKAGKQGDADSGEADQSTNQDSEKVDEAVSAESVEAKEFSGYNLGFSGSLYFVQGDFFESIPAGGSIVLSTPWGFDLGSLRLGLSATLGAYPAKHNTGESLTPICIGSWGQSNFSKLIFTEGHVGLVEVMQWVREDLPVSH